MSKEYAGDDLLEIREILRGEGFTEMHENNGHKGFDVWRPFADLGPADCVHTVVWPRSEGGFWLEEY